MAEVSMDVEALQKMRRRLIDVAMGRQAADLVVRDGRWVCVQSGEIVEHTDIAVSGGRVAYVGEDASHTVGKGTKVIEAGGRYLVPGLLDGHMHVESGMVTVTEFVRAVLPHGTTGMFIDPHEIANVFGLRGVRLMHDQAQLQPIHVWVEVPSCVPSSPGFETPGAVLGPAEIAEALAWPGVIGLGEMMNFHGVVQDDDQVLAEMAATEAADKVIGGHYPAPDLGREFHAYAAGGAADDHEGTRLEDAVARVRQGMTAMLRLGSAWHDIAAQTPAITELGLDSRHFMLVTDDSHSGTLVHDGHMDRVVRHAIKQGLPPMTAIQMATLNTAEHFGVADDVGQIAPGRWADIVVASDLEDLRAEQVIARGALVAEDGRLTVELPDFKFPEDVKNSVHLKRPLEPSDFVIHASGAGIVRANVIGVIENQAPTRHIQMDLKPNSGELKADVSRDLAKVALVERHRGSGTIQLGLVQGFGLNVACAVGSTVAHDSHHMLVVGTDEACMAVAGNELARVGGGQIVVRQGKVEALLELPIAGLMSDERADVVADKAEGILAGLRACGCELNNANMQLSLLALVVIPELRISDMGLVDVMRHSIVPLEESNG
jgi:adenine deaminase